MLPPPASEPLPPLSSLSSARPSPLLSWQLLELLYAYCFTMRLFNGDWADGGGAGDAAAVAMAVSESLSAAGAAAEAASAAKRSGAARGRGASSEGVGSNSRNGHEQQQRIEPAAMHSSLNSPVTCVGTKDSASGVASSMPQRPLEAAVMPCGTRCAVGASRGSGTAAEPSSVPQSASEAAITCLQRACAPPVGDPSGRSFAVAVLQDAVAVLSAGRPAVLLALTDLKRLFDAAGELLGFSSKAHEIHYASCFEY